MDHEAYWQSSGPRHLFDEQVVTSRYALLSELYGREYTQSTPTLLL